MFTRWILMAFVIFTAAIAALAVVASVFSSIDWNVIAPQLIALVIMVGLLHWLSTLVPGPIKKVGKSIGKHAWKAIRGSNTRRGGGH